MPLAKSGLGCSNFQAAQSEAIASKEQNEGKRSRVRLKSRTSQKY
ncbi:MAG: hypothetical protein RBR54_09830 [Sulfurimonas sp.]|nr:hypothetical protein [Sulfurimonas sp.]